MKRFLPVLLLGAALLPLLAPPAAAASQSFQLAAKESGCPSGSAYCFDKATLGPVAPGDSVTITFSNPSGNQLPHNLCAKVGDQQQCAPEANRYVDVGNTTTLNFNVPASGVTAIAYWCNFPGHKALGMTGNVTVQSTTTNPPSGGNTNPPPSGGSSGNSTPGVGVASIVVGVGLLAVALRRR